MPKAEAKPSTSLAENIEDAKKPKLEIQEKLKVLCLHGYRQNDEAFKSKIGSFRKHVGKYAEFVFAKAPHIVVQEADASTESDTSEDKKSDEQRSWWFNSMDGKSFKGTNKSAAAYKFHESVKYIEQIWEEQGPFQGLLGFSQGACFAALLCGLNRKNMTKVKPKFVVIAAGFLSGSLAHINYFDEPVTIPSLHIFGQTDEIIPSTMSEALIKKFEHAEILTHPGGHYFPATSAQKQTYVNFFQDRLQDYLEEIELARMKAEGLLEMEVSEDSGDDSNTEES